MIYYFLNIIKDKIIYKKTLSFLIKNNIKNFILNKQDIYGYTVDVHSSVNLKNKNLKSIPIQFNIIYGDFDCSHNLLESLNGCPKVVNGSFNCSFNLLNSLEQSPLFISDHYYCQNNKIVNLKGIPSKINGNLNASNNLISSLLFSPLHVNGNLILNSNKLTNINNLSLFILKNLYLNHNDIQLNSLLNIETQIKSNFIDISNNENLNNLQYINKYSEFLNILKIIHQKKQINDLIYNIPKKNINVSINKI